MSISMPPAAGGDVRVLPAAPLKGIDASRFNAESEIPELARALAECAGRIDPKRLERGLHGCCVYADAIVLSDDIIDYWAGGNTWARQVPHVGARFLEAAMIWSELLPPANLFWAALRRYHQEYVETMALEGAIADGDRSWESCDEALCLQIVRGKNGPVRGLASLVAGLANDARLLDDFETLSLGYFAATQMLDDIKDWREDIRDGNVSLVLRRTTTSRPSLDDVRSIGIRMYAEGHVDYVLELACTQLRELSALAQRLGATRYRRLLDKRTTHLTALAQGLQRDLAAQRQQRSRH